jgi:hypothetical protein
MWGTVHSSCDNRSHHLYMTLNHPFISLNDAFGDNLWDVIITLNGDSYVVLHNIMIHPPYGLYNSHYMCLVSKRADCSPNPIRIVHSKLMEMPMTRGFAP